MRKAVSVTLQNDNLLWLRAQATASSRGSLSEVLDALVTEARAGGRHDGKTMRSVVGTIDLPEDDANLEGADAFVRAQFDRSLKRPLLVKASSTKYPASAKRRG